MSSLERNLGIFPTLQPLRPQNPQSEGGGMTGRPPAATTLPICSTSPRTAPQRTGTTPLRGKPIPAENPSRRLGGIDPEPSGPGGADGARGSIGSQLAQHPPARSHANARWPSHAGHGRDLVELVPIQPIKFIHLKQPIFHQAGEDKQESCKTEIEATFDFVALNA